MFDSIFACFDVCLIYSGKNHVVCHISKLTLMSYDSVVDPHLSMGHFFSICFFRSHF